MARCHRGLVAAALLLLFLLPGLFNALPDSRNRPARLAAAKAARLKEVLEAGQLHVLDEEQPGPGPGPTVLVSTLDGSLHAVCADSGLRRWSLTSDAPLVDSFFVRSGQPGQPGSGQSQRSSALSTQRSESFARAIPGADGVLYFAPPGGSLLRMPVTVPELVAASPLRDESQAFHYIGSKRSKILAIDELSGDVHRVFDPSEAPGQVQYDRLGLQENLLWISRTDLTVHALDSESGNLFWNVSVGSYSSIDSQGPRAQPELSALFGAGLRGSLFRFDPSLQGLRWKLDFGSPVTRIQLVPGRGGSQEKPASGAFHPLPLFYLSADWETKFGERPAEPRALQALSRELRARAGPGAQSVAVYVQTAASGAAYALSDSLPELAVLEGLPPAEPRWALPEPPPECGPGSWSPGCLSRVHLLPGPSRQLVPAQPARPFDPRELPHNFPNFPLAPRDPAPGAPGTPGAPGARGPEPAPFPLLLWAVTTLAIGAALFQAGRLWVETRAPPASAPELPADSGPEPAEQAASGSVAEPAEPAEPEFRLEEHFPADARGELIGGSASETPLLLSDELLGCGSQGTRVYKGWFGRRIVAVKRLVKPLSLFDFEEEAAADEEKEASEELELASDGSQRSRSAVVQALREISLLIESDAHPNVLRYYAKKEDSNFLYLALEICSHTLADAVEGPAAAGLPLLGAEERVGVLQGMLAGLSFLHSIGIVHRDLKPQNILLTADAPPRCKIADMGLGTRLDLQRSSFAPTVAGGSVGWQAPEVLRFQVFRSRQQQLELQRQLREKKRLEEGGAPRRRGKGSRRKGAPEAPPRLTKAVDVFSAGCVVHFTLSGGQHPFGSFVEREYNVMHGRRFAEAEDPLLRHLVESMTAAAPEDRLSAAEALAHPALWSEAKRLELLMDASDILEKEPEGGELRLSLETRAAAVLRGSWDRHIPPELLLNLGKYRKYNFGSVRDLLRVMRNKRHHFEDLPPLLRKQMGPIPGGYLRFFDSRFPQLLLHIYLLMSRFCFKTDGLEDADADADAAGASLLDHASAAALANSDNAGKKKGRWRLLVPDADAEEPPARAAVGVRDGGPGLPFLPLLAKFYEELSPRGLSLLQNSRLLDDQKQ